MYFYKLLFVILIAIHVKTSVANDTLNSNKYVSSGYIMRIISYAYSDSCRATFIYVPKTNTAFSKIEKIYHDSIIINRNFSVAILSDSIFNEISKDIVQDNFYNILLAQFLLYPREIKLFKQNGASLNDIEEFTHYSNDFILIDNFKSHFYFCMSNNKNVTLSNSHVISLDYIDIEGYFVPTSDSVYLQTCGYISGFFNHNILPDIYPFNIGKTTESLLITSIIHYNKKYYLDFKASQKKNYCRIGKRNYKRKRRYPKKCLEYKHAFFYLYAEQYINAD